MRRSHLIAFAALLVASPAFACSGPSFKISGDFQSGEKAWGESDAQFQLKGAEAVFTAQVGTQTARWNAGTPLTDLDACVTIAMPQVTADASRSYAGMLFWVVDKDNFYQAVIAPNGMFTVARKVSGKIVPTAPVAWLQSDAVKTGANEKNTLRVTLEGQTVIVRINDKEIARFRGQAPEAPSYVGLVASSAPAAVDTWSFTDLKVTEGAAATTAATSPPSMQPSDATGAVSAAPVAGCGNGKVLFDDEFKVHDPLWGAKSAELDIANGQAEFDPAPGTPTLRWNRGFVFGDLDACASVSLAKATTDPTTSYAGLIFWVEDSRNYYQAVIAPNGYFTVARIADGKAVAKRPVEWKKVPAIKSGAQEKNVLRITAKGRDVQIAINGQARCQLHSRSAAHAELHRHHGGVGGEQERRYLADQRLQGDGAAVTRRRPIRLVCGRASAGGWRRRRARPTGRPSAPSRRRALRSAGCARATRRTRSTDPRASPAARRGGAPRRCAARDR